MGTMDHKAFFQLANWCMVVIEGSYDRGSAFLLSKNGHSLLSVHVISQEMLQILYFPMGDPINHGLKYWIFPLSGHPSVTCRSTHIWVALTWMAASWTCLCISSSVSATTGSWASTLPVNPNVTPSRIGLYSFHIQPWCSSAQGICSCIVLSLLVLNTKGESCEWFYPVVSSSI